MSGRRLSEQERIECDRILNEWLEKVGEIPAYEERHPKPNRGNVLDGGYNGLYTELERIYKPQLDAILGRAAQEDVKKAGHKKFSDLIEKRTEPLRIPDYLKKK